jgi:carbonic anhydrase
MIVQDDSNTCTCTEFSLTWDLERAPDALATFENNEVTIKGNFGSIDFSHKEKGKEDKTTTYFAKSLNFKTPSEHKLDSAHTDGEILLTLESSAGDDIILSFMVEIADLDAPNEFVASLLPESWPSNEDDEIEL